jgi:hypothetical protein
MKRMQIIIPYIFFLLYKSNKICWRCYGKCDDEGNNPMDNPNIYNVEGGIYNLPPVGVQDREISDTRGYDFNRSLTRFAESEND